MSQGRTIVPGECIDTFEMSKRELDMSFYDQLYHRSPSEESQNIMDSGKTVVNVKQVGNLQPDIIQKGVTARLNRDVILQDRMIVGVLFSISRTGLGEIFPLYLGRNKIGSNGTNDICLREQTIIDEHAVIYVRKVSCEDNKLEVSLTSYCPQGETMVGDTDVMFEPVMVYDGNVISIGMHYRFVIRLFEMENLGLYEDPSFTGIEPNSICEASEAPHNPVGDTPIPDGTYNDLSSLESIYSSDSDFSDNTSKTVLI